MSPRHLEWGGPLPCSHFVSVTVFSYRRQSRAFKPTRTHAEEHFRPRGDSLEVRGTGAES